MNAKDDTQNIDAVLDALYTSISGPVGAARDWARRRSLMFPGARLVRTTVTAGGTAVAQAMDARSYEADTADTFRREPFFEKEVARHVDRFGCIAQVFSVYEARRAPEDAEPFKRGINSIQLFHDGSRWWIVSILWDNEREDNRVPREYLP